MNRKSGIRPVIGLLTDWSESPYQTGLRTGVVDAAEENDANLICFIGGAIHSTNQSEAQRNYIYSLANKENIDGLVICSASISHYITIDKMVEFCMNFSGIPMTSIALQIPGIPSVLADNRKGMEDLLQHLIEHHKYRKIAFISGPENNPEAVERFLIYKQSLEQHDIPFNPQLFVEGDFKIQAGINAVRTLVDERRVEFDAVIAANDDIAFGVLSGLHERGIQVPAEVAVAGFDDVEESKYNSPALTTVRQPIYQQAKKATELLLDQLKGREVQSRVALPTELIIRESCGCLPEKLLKFSSKKEKYNGMPFNKLSVEERRTIIDLLSESAAEFETDISLVIRNNWAEALLDAFYKEIAENRNGAFLQTFTSFLYKSNNSDAMISVWQKILTLFRECLLPCLSDPGQIFWAETIWQQARIMISEIAHRFECITRMRLTGENQVMRDLSEKLITRLEFAPLLAFIEEELPRIGIKMCYLSLYEKNDSDKAKLILAFNEAGRITGKNGNINHKRGEIIPRGMEITNRRYTMILEALFHGTEQLGFGLFEMGPRDGRIYETLRIRISSALRGALLFQQLQAQADNLEKEVKSRTADLVKANKKLKQEIRERKHAEEELRRSNLELEQFAYIASHDLQEPLRMVGSFVGLLARRYKDQIDKNANEYIEFIVDGVNRMRNMINDLLIYSRVKTRSKEKEDISLDKILEESIEALQLVAEEKKAAITHGAMPVVTADGTQMRQLFQNLLSNALKFHNEAPPVIHISTEENEKEFIIAVRDNGIGIDPEYKDNIFIMFKRLHTREEYPGTGIGLAICKKIIELHKGRIWVDSKPGAGATFYFTLPKKGERNDRHGKPRHTN